MSGSQFTVYSPFFEPDVYTINQAERLFQYPCIDNDNMNLCSVMKGHNFVCINKLKSKEVEVSSLVSSIKGI